MDFPRGRAGMCSEEVKRAELQQVSVAGEWAERLSIRWKGKACLLEREALGEARCGGEGGLGTERQE